MVQELMAGVPVAPAGVDKTASHSAPEKAQLPLVEES